MSSSTSIPLTSQVGGHAGVRSSADGAQIIKPCLPAERAFYETVIHAQDPAFALLAKHVPRFYGVAPAEADGGKDEYLLAPRPAIASLRLGLILENLSHAFTRPNILDIKLGTVLYDEHASEEKKQRMIKSAKETTSFDTGVRITGFQVYDTTTQSSINIPKDYGRALKVAQLPEAMARFFPIKTPLVALSSPTPEQEEYFPGGPTQLEPSPAGTPPALLLPVLRGILGAIREIRTAIAGTELRMVGGSVLIIYEGDPTVLARALDAHEEAIIENVTEQSIQGKEEAKETITTLVGAVADPAAAQPSARDGIIPAYAVKLIDFAHTKVEQGIGQDEGVVLGLDTTISLLEGRIKEVEEVLGSVTSVV
ncbi:related to ARG82-dual-specificity inositol polyphosphate kinase required for regulation of phosphate-and nitrogen-responsive genes [Serendipita indica DSM 11827]|uniref:Kinase n=1 Tax=Serendipita indica (strain DSM 11827) TaxID=1109443 RepID=G4TFU8_SERID|nr:related to ARG82-dual-specificity inositol polyphosphate kinase required for regulation of phosphate-and nitrogen-responsive genes [Serendipita indica DSM 11827]